MTFDETAYQKILGDELLALRLRRGWTREHLRKHLQRDKSTQTLGFYEQGERNISVLRLADLCNAMGERPHDLLARVHNRLDQPGKILLDLTRVTASTHPDLQPLRNWAHNRLTRQPPDSTREQTIQVDLTAFDAVATLCGMTTTELTGRLQRVTLHIGQSQRSWLLASHAPHQDPGRPVRTRLSPPTNSTSSTFLTYTKDSTVPTPRENMPTVRSRALGYQLQHLIRTAGLSGHEIARRLDIYPSLLSYATNGLRCLSDTDLVAILVTCRVDRHERERILRLNHDLTHRGWLQHHDATQNTWSRTLASHETRATRIVDMQTLRIPPLLQTEDYARTVFRGLTTSSTAVESLLTAQRGRQAIFSKYPLPKMLFFLPETTLRAPAGDASMMSEQLQHLLVNAALPRVEIRVIPRTAGVHAGSAGSFTLLESDTFAPIVHLGGLTFEVFLEQPQQIDEHQHLITFLDSVALSNDESMTMITAADSDL